MFINKATDQSNLDMSDGRDLNYYLEMTKDYKPDFTFNIKQIDGYNVSFNMVLKLRWVTS
jgi:hypothetical protein